MVNGLNTIDTVDVPKLIPGGALARALLVLSTLCFGLGITLPLVETTQLWFFRDAYSVIQTVERLYFEDEIILAGLIALFSVLVPVFKALALTWLNLVRPDRTSRGILYAADMIGRYAWVEVLIIAVLITIYSAQPGLDIQTREGLWFFAASAAGFGIAASLIRRTLNAPPKNDHLNADSTGQSSSD